MAIELRGEPSMDWYAGGGSPTGAALGESSGEDAVLL